MSLMYDDDDLSPIGQWDARIEDLDIGLARLRAQRDASAPGTELHQMSQAEADHEHWRLRAHKLARPVLDGLYRDLDRQMRTDEQHRASADLDAMMWTRVASGVGLLAVVAMLISAWRPGPWWLVAAAIVAVVGCVAASRAAWTARADWPDPAGVLSLSARIDAIQQACSDCESADGLDHVRLVIRPSRPGTALVPTPAGRPPGASRSTSV